MKLDELKEALRARLETLEKYPDLKCSEIENCVLFTMPAPKYFIETTRAYPLKVRTPFGLTRWYPNQTGITIYPTIKQVKSLIDKLESKP